MGVPPVLSGFMLPFGETHQGRDPSVRHLMTEEVLFPTGAHKVAGKTRFADVFRMHTLSLNLVMMQQPLASSRPLSAIPFRERAGMHSS